VTDLTVPEVEALVRQLFYSRSPVRRAAAAAALMAQELPLSEEAILLAARRQRALEEMELAE
jgi:hypothetical protein